MVHSGGGKTAMTFLWIDFAAPAAPWPGAAPTARPTGGAP